MVQADQKAEGIMPKYKVLVQNIRTGKKSYVTVSAPNEAAAKNAVAHKTKRGEVVH